MEYEVIKSTLKYLSIQVFKRNDLSWEEEDEKKKKSAWVSEWVKKKNKLESVEMTRECIKMDHKIASHNTFIIEYRECVIIKKNLQKDFKNY